MATNTQTSPNSAGSSLRTRFCFLKQNVHISSHWTKSHFKPRIVSSSSLEAFCPARTNKLMMVSRCSPVSLSVERIEHPSSRQWIACKALLSSIRMLPRGEVETGAGSENVTEQVEQR